MLAISRGPLGSIIGPREPSSSPSNAVDLCIGDEDLLMVGAVEPLTLPVVALVSLTVLFPLPRRLAKKLVMPLATEGPLLVNPLGPF